MQNTKNIETENKFAVDFNFGFAGAPSKIEDIKKLLGQRWEVTLQKIYYIILEKGLIHHNTVDLAQTDRHLEILGTQQALSKIIKKCKLIKLLDPIKTGDKESYKVGKQGKTYHVNTVLASIISNFGKANNYKAPAKEKKKLVEEIKTLEEVASEVCNGVASPSYDIDNDIFKNVKIGEYKGEDFETLKNYPDELLLAQLHANYPQIKFISGNNDKFNQDCITPELKRRSQINIHRGANSIKFSFRDYCDVCSLIKSSDEGKANREGFFSRYFANPNPAEYDLKSSIYKITHFINFGTWADNTRDFYAEFAPIGIKKEERGLIKAIAMYIYFSDLSDKQIVNQIKIKEFYQKEIDFCNEEKKKADKAQNNKLMQAELALSIRKAQLQSLVAEVRENMCKVIGKPLGSEVFVHESAIMNVLLMYAVKKFGKAVCIYDAIFADVDKAVFNNFCELNIAKIAKFYKEKFLTK